MQINKMKTFLTNRRALDSKNESSYVVLLEKQL